MHMKWIAIPLATAAALLAAPAAHADATDDDFVTYAHYDGIDGSPAQLVKAAHDVCKVIDLGTTSPRALTATIMLDDPSITNPLNAAALAGAAVAAFCPTNRYAFGGGDTKVEVV
jgi:hypothetical protein